MTAVSVLTLATGRGDHLVNLVIGLMHQSHTPLELIIAALAEATFDNLPAAGFPIRRIDVGGPGLKLSRARNAAAAAASGDIVVFLDVDCIPAPDLCSDYAHALVGFDGLVMGEVAYLPAGVASQGWSYADFDAVAVKHSDRQGPPPEGLELCSDYRCFWSLNFAMSRRRFMATGGFDDRYVGYGGEDTDFGKTIDRQGVPLAWTKGARAYHQHHPHHMPPVHHLRSVVRNAELFESKWGYRTMGHWLHAFRMMGLIDDRPGGPIRILRDPDAADMALTGQTDEQPYTNTTSVIRRLEARLAAAAKSSPNDGLP